MPSVPDYFDCFWHVAPHRENSHGPGESFILTRAINLIPKLANSVQVRENLENRQNLGIHGISKFLSQPSSFMGSEDWLRNCGPYSWIGRHDRRDLEIDPYTILMMRWERDGTLGSWHLLQKPRLYADATHDNIVTLMTSPGMLTKLGATDMSVQILGILDPVLAICIEYASMYQELL